MARSEYGEESSEVLPPPPHLSPGTVPARISGHGSASASSSRQGHTATALVPPKATRPGFGRQGQPTNLYVNHFRVLSMEPNDVYHYNVKIDPPVVATSYRREIMKSLREIYSPVEWHGNKGAYDGNQSLFSSERLNFAAREFPVFMEDSKGRPPYRPGDGDRGRHSGSSCVTQKPRGSVGEDVRSKRRKTVSRGREYKVTITFASKVRMSAIAEMMKGVTGTCNEELEKRASDAFHVLDIVLRESASQRGYLLVRDNFYHPTLGSVCDLGEGVDGWRGYHTSVKPTGSGLTLNLDITMTTVLKPVYVENFLKEKFRVQDLRHLSYRDWHTKAKAVLKGIRIETRHDRASRTYKIAGFSEEPIRELSFQKRIRDDAGNVREQKMSVRDYFKETYEYTLKYPDLPALDVGNRKKPVYVPIELGKIVAGQRYMKTLTPKQKNNMIGACKQKPRERQQLCENAMRINNYNSDEMIKEFGLVFDDKLAVISGRILPPPQLQFGNGRIEVPREGSWNFNNKEVYKGVRIAQWVVAVFDNRTYDGDRIAFQLMQSCNRQGLKMEEPAMVTKEHPHDQSQTPQKRVESMLSEFKEIKPVLILAVMPTDDSNTALYEAFKRMCEIQVGVVSQCMRPHKLSPQYFGNLALKINLKMGGLNSHLPRNMIDCLWPSTIIFGMDVSHGSPGEDVPSIAAVVATKNWPRAFQYGTRARTQQAKLEMIEDLRGMVKSLLFEYHETCQAGINPKPTQIIVYRDGLSESQFAECLEKEVTAFRSACADMDSSYKPGITFIVAQKRHNTRIFPQGHDAMRNGNVIPGTVVDRDICHPHNYDFFLVSQAGLIGTSRPTHYHVLVNRSNKFTPDDIQSITNKLCYTYGRCSKSISMAAPAAYAHLVAKRYRIFAKELDTSGRGRALSSVQAHQDLTKIGSPFSMFYC